MKHILLKDLIRESSMHVDAIDKTNNKSLDNANAPEEDPMAPTKEGVLVSAETDADREAKKKKSNPLGCFNTLTIRVDGETQSVVPWSTSYTCFNTLTIRVDGETW